MARREHSREELAGKLAAHGEAGEITDLLDTLQQEGLLSDSRFAEALRQSRVGKYGSLRLRDELRRKGVAEDLLASEYRQAQAADFDAAREVWRRRFGSPPMDLKEKSRQYRFLLGRGFPSEIVSRVLGGLDDDSD